MKAEKGFYHLTARLRATTRRASTRLPINGATCLQL